VVGLTVAGLVEGLAIGSAQAWVLARYVPSVSGRRWVGATVLAAGLAWLAGMGGASLLGAEGAPVGLVLVLVVPAWVAGLLSMGYLQWLVLRRQVPRSSRWIWVTAGAWLVGVMIPVATLSAVPNNWPTWTFALAGVAGAVLMGLTVGAITGRTLHRLLAGADRRAERPPTD
jgi:membrane protease YdiL (CAAX protease family)